MIEIGWAVFVVTVVAVVAIFINHWRKPPPPTPPGDRFLEMLESAAEFQIQTAKLVEAAAVAEAAGLSLKTALEMMEVTEEDARQLGAALHLLEGEK